VHASGFALQSLCHAPTPLSARSRRWFGRSVLIAQVQRHAVEAHGMALSPEQALLLAFRAQLGETAWSRPGIRASTQDIKRSRQRRRRDS
jgi:hypothetical protein